MMVIWWPRSCTGSIEVHVAFLPVADLYIKTNQSHSSSIQRIGLFITRYSFCVECLLTIMRKDPMVGNGVL